MTVLFHLLSLLLQQKTGHIIDVAMLNLHFNITNT